MPPLSKQKLGKNYFEDRRIGQSKMLVLVKLEAALRVLEIR